MEYIRYMGHYTLLLDRFSSGAEKAVYYSGVIVRNRWSRDMLRGFIDTDLFNHKAYLDCIQQAKTI